jgi:hypothetical protein
MQSTLTEQTPDPHDTFAIDPEIVLAMRADLVEHELARAASPPSAPTISVAPSPMGSGPVVPGLMAPGLTAPGLVAPGPVASGPALSGPNLSGLMNSGPKMAGPRPPGPISAPTMMSDFSAGGLVPPVDPRLQPSGALGDIRVPRRPRPKNRWAARTSYGFLFALCSTIALAVWDQYGDAAQTMIGRWIPPLGAVSAQAPQQTAAAAPSDAPAVQAAAPPDSAPAQPAPAAAQPAPDISASAAATAPAVNLPANPPAVIAAATDSGPTTQSMAHDMAAMGQQIEALKATVEQLRAGQDQMSQQLARIAAPKPMAMAKPPVPRPQVSALSPRPAVLPAHKPRPAFSPELANAALGSPRGAQATAPLPLSQAAPTPYQSRPSQVIDRNDGDPVDRPPMPVH